MGWKIPDLPRPWVFSVDSRYSGSSRGLQSKISKRGNTFWLVHSLPDGRPPVGAVMHIEGQSPV